MNESDLDMGAWTWRGWTAGDGARVLTVSRLRLLAGAAPITVVVAGFAAALFHTGLPVLGWISLGVAALLVLQLAVRARLPARLTVTPAALGYAPSAGAGWRLEWSEVADAVMLSNNRGAPVGVRVLTTSGGHRDLQEPWPTQLPQLISAIRVARVYLGGQPAPAPLPLADRAG